MLLGVFWGRGQKTPTHIKNTNKFNILERLYNFSNILKSIAIFYTII